MIDMAGTNESFEFYPDKYELNIFYAWKCTWYTEMLGDAAIMNINHHLCSTVLLLFPVLQQLLHCLIIPFWACPSLSLNCSWSRVRIVID